MSQEHRRRSARRGRVWRTITAIAGAAAMVTAMTALAPAASATGGGQSNYFCHQNDGGGYTWMNGDAFSDHMNDRNDIIPPWIAEGGVNWSQEKEIWKAGCQTPSTTYDVTVSKVWKVNGVEVSAGAAAGHGLTATLKIMAGLGQAEEKEWGESYPYAKKTWLTLSEDVLNTGGCVADLLHSKLPVLPFQLTEDTPKTFVNAYLCPPQVTVEKTWVINGEAVSPDVAKTYGLEAVPTISVKGLVKYGTPKEIAWNSPYSDWGFLSQPKLRIDENVTNTGDCTVDEEYETPSLPMDFKLTKDTTKTLVNAYTCPTVTITLNKEWDGASDGDSADLTISIDGVPVGAPGSSTWSAEDNAGKGSPASYTGQEGDGVTISESSELSDYESSWACYPAGGGYLRNPAASAFVNTPEGEAWAHGSGTASGLLELPDFDLDCYFTNVKKQPPTTTFQQPTSVSPSYDAQCIVGETGNQITVAVPEVINGIRYVVDDQGTDSVTITASPADTGKVLTLPADSPWTMGSGGSATITINASSPAELICTAGEQKEEPPAQEVKGESATKPKTEQKVKVKGESKEVAQGAPSATAKTGESGPAYWTYLTLAAGVLLLIGSARIRRRDDEA